MKCPWCREETKVMETRNGRERRRRCTANPEHRFWTVEQVVIKGRKGNHDLKHGLGPNGPSILDEIRMP